MAALLKNAQTLIHENLYSTKEEDWKEKSWASLESVSGLKREKIIVLAVTLTIMYVILGSVLPFVTHFICIIYPLIQNIKLLGSSNKSIEEHSNYLFYWNFYALFTMLDFSPVSSLPFYYFLKAGLFAYLYLPTTNGMSKLAKTCTPAVKYAESWVNRQEPEKETEKTD